MKDDSKPIFTLPTMADIVAIPWNGLTVASTFSGCGGSCLGYRMAGYRVGWANEFVPAAQASYLANYSSESHLDTRDIREVKPQDILKSLGMTEGELDLFDGSPPCQAFSTAGKGSKGWGKAKKYGGGAEQCNELLFDEYIRLLRGLKPRAFVAENVAGLARGKAKGFFLEILDGLKRSGYKVKAKLLDAQWLGVPQRRQRIIFVGVRDDIALAPVFPRPLPYRYSIRDALPAIGRVTLDSGGIYPIKVNDGDDPSVTITCSNANQIKVGDAEAGSLDGIASVAHPVEKRKFTTEELRRICSFPSDFVLKGSYSQQWERLGNSVPPVMMHAIAAVIRDEILLHNQAKQ